MVRFSQKIYQVSGYHPIILARLGSPHGSCSLPRSQCLGTGHFRQKIQPFCLCISMRNVLQTLASTFINQKMKINRFGYIQCFKTDDSLTKNLHLVRNCPLVRMYTNFYFQNFHGFESSYFSKENLSILASFKR